MINVIVAFSREDDARKIKSILMKHGIHVAAVCTSVSQTLAAAEGLGNGIVVCGHGFRDAGYADIRNALSERYDVLLIASPVRCEGKPLDGVVFLPLPLMPQDLIGTVNVMSHVLEQRLRRMKRRPGERSGEEKRVIEKAKALLMERNHMSEEEAHKYIQKCSMDSGTNLVETAQMVLKLYR